MNIANSIVGRSILICLNGSAFQSGVKFRAVITKNHTLGFLFPFLYFHKFNGGFKYGFFLSRFYFKGTDNSRGMFMYWSHVGAAQDMKLLNKGSTEDLGFISQLTCILI